MSRPSTPAMPDPEAERDHTEHLPRGGRRSGRLVAIAVAAIAAAVATWAATGPSGHPGGDPGGRILTALQPVKTVVPAGATDVSTRAQDSTYGAKCPDNPGGRSGWGPVTVLSTFRSTLPGRALVATIGGRLSQLGWQQVTPVWDRNFDQFQPQAAWQKTLFPGQTATATVYQLPAGSGPYTGSWHLSAVAKPPGFALPGC